MKVVVVGKGGREHALAKKMAASSKLTDMWVCPGNPGMLAAGITCVPIEKPEAIEKFCIENQVDLVVIGPEAVILSDLKKNLQKQGIRCFAPSAEAARLESSKVFCKKVLQESGVLTAALTIAENLSQAMNFIESHNFESPLVIKADGLAQGKGVWICESQEKANEAVDSLTRQFGWPLLLEECLIGRELSAFALCDGEDFVILGTACDYKRITPDPFSANTGGMGAYSPCDFVTSEDEQTIQDIFSKTLRYLGQNGLSYQGFLFAGLMKTSKGLYVLEYNVRMGDPETQALMPRIESDLLELIDKATLHRLKNQTCRLTPSFAVHVVAVSEGYPQANMLLQKKLQLPLPEKLNGEIYFAGISELNGELVNSGGRVLGVTVVDSTKDQARQRAYEDMRLISFEGMYYREDIAQ